MERLNRSRLIKAELEPVVPRWVACALGIVIGICVASMAWGWCWLQSVKAENERLAWVEVFETKSRESESGAISSWREYYMTNQITGERKPAHLWEQRGTWGTVTCPMVDGKKHGIQSDGLEFVDGFYVAKTKNGDKLKIRRIKEKSPAK